MALAQNTKREDMDQHRARHYAILIQSTKRRNKEEKEKQRSREAKKKRNQYGKEEKQKRDILSNLRYLSSSLRHMPTVARLRARSDSRARAEAATAACSESTWGVSDI